MKQAFHPLPNGRGSVVTEPHASASGSAPVHTTLDLNLEVCREAEAKIHEARQLLLDARPGAIDRCQKELLSIAGMLERLVAEGTFQSDSRVSPALHRIRDAAQALGRQIEYALNLYFGWIQVRLGAGYSEQGLPVLIASEPGSYSFEG